MLCGATKLFSFYNSIGTDIQTIPFLKYFTLIHKKMKQSKYPMRTIYYMFSVVRYLAFVSVQFISGLVVEYFTYNRWWWWWEFGYLASKVQNVSSRAYRLFFTWLTWLFLPISTLKTICCCSVCFSCWTVLWSQCWCSFPGSSWRLATSWSTL